MNIAIADIHCHPILRLYNGNKDIWFSDEVDDSKRHKNFPGFAEAEFAALARSRVRLVFVSLYPVEQGFISNLAKHADIFPEKPFINKVVNEVIGYIVKTYSKNGTVIDFLEKSATHWLSSMTYEKFEDIRSCNHDYYNDLKNELDYLEKSVKKVKLSTNPVTTPTGLAIPTLTPPMPEDRTIGRMGRMHGESIVTTPARNENKISKYFKFLFPKLFD